MRYVSRILLTLALGHLLVGVAHATESPKPVSLLDTNPFTGIGTNALNAFWGWNLALHLGGVASAAAIVESGADTRFHNALVDQQFITSVGTPAVYGVYLLPFVLGGSLMGYGLGADSSTALSDSCAVLQASLLALVYQSILKSVTGRPPPEPVRYPDDSASRTFRWGFMRGGIHYGWPSGHMMTSTAMLASLLRLHPDSWWLRLGGSALLGFVAFSVAGHEQSSMHWLSDMAAGTLMGYAIGTSVGEGFARHGQAASTAIRVAPMLAGPTRGLSLSMAF